ncbi:DNA damage-induced apoptosis suppressor protein [Gouania willdenowi]|uniref:Replication factor A C-terminal domain-containing protein n=1 Tax=Gouania willdenowi TaxID=441366 RepID=A0A8C5EJ53_GOUWI|nr:DNA damage-induced apoptosis suppressor protein [Gouania willdenowi]
MSVRRVLVDCAVLSVQDSCVFYPNCRSCFSRLDIEQEENNRCRCSRCGYMCVREQVDYRYRLSLKVERSSRILGITVFGSSLNQFFGVQAPALQRIVEHQDGPIEPSARVKLLLKATEDCFIGRHFIFGLKLNDRENGLWSEGSLPNNGSTDVTQFVASQMILPDASGLGGSTVVRYYQALLHKASQYQLGSPYLSKGSRFPDTPLLLDPTCSPSWSLDDVRLSDFRLLSQSCKRALNRSCPLSPTPPWQQSLGVITSSAEQEEEGEEQREVLESHSVPKQELNLSKSQSFSKNLDSAVVNRIISSQPVYKTNSFGEVSSNSLTNSFLSSSAAQWVDLPFSESLTEFIGEKNENTPNFLKQTEHHLHVICQRETAGNNPGVHSPAAGQKNSQMLLDITNTPASTGNNGCYDFRNDSKPSPHKNKSQALNTFHCNQKDEESNLTFERKLKEDAYNCSADLFSGSLMSSTSYDVIRSSPDSSEPISTEGNKTDSFIPQHVDFVPPSQSTPIVKPSNSYKHESSCRRNNTKHNLEDFRKTLFKRKKRTSWKDLNSVCSIQRLNCTPVNRVWKTMKYKRSAGACDDSMCDGDNGEMLVPPTPAGKKESSEIRQTGFSSGDLTPFKDKQRDNDYREKTPSTHSNTGVESTGKRDIRAGDDDDDFITNENVAFDGSRDLFSDSL